MSDGTGFSVVSSPIVAPYTVISSAQDHFAREGGAGGLWQNVWAVDLKAPPGTPVYAPFDGKLTKVDAQRQGEHDGTRFGASIHLKSTNGHLQAFLTHLNGVSSKTGVVVHKGDLLGYVTDWSGGSSHLHFAVAELVAGVWTGRDPETLLDPTGAGGAGHPPGHGGFLGALEAVIAPVGKAVEAIAKLLGSHEPADSHGSSDGHEATGVSHDPGSKGDGGSQDSGGGHEATGVSHDAGSKGDGGSQDSDGGVDATGVYHEAGSQGEGGSQGSGGDHSDEGAVTDGGAQGNGH